MKIQNCALTDGVGRNCKECSFKLSVSSMVINKNEPINIHKDVDFISLNDLWLEIAKKAKEINMNANDTPMNISKEYAKKLFVMVCKFSINIISKSRLYNCYV